VHALEGDPRERALEDRDSTEAGRADRVAVERAIERDEALLSGCPELPPCLRAHFDRRVDGGRPIVDVEDARQAARHGREQLLGEARGRLVGHPGQGAMRELARLLLERTQQPRMPVPQGGDVPRRVAVEIPPAIDVLEPGAAGTTDDDRVDAAPLVHRRVGVPDVRAVQAHDGVAVERFAAAHSGRVVIA
jgi:hypothetical protein